MLDKTETIQVKPMPLVISINIHSCYTHVKTLMYCVIHRYTNVLHIIYTCYTCMYNNDIHTVLHSCVKCLITRVLQ